MRAAELGRLLRRLAAAFCMLVAGSAQAAAAIVILNQNAPGEGFNDPTPVAPVGGNRGTTLGEQRLIAFQRAATIWGAALDSKITIRIAAAFAPLACSASSAVIGAAGAAEVSSDFENAPRANTWYPAALANKLAGRDLSTPEDPHIVAVFNSRLGLFPDCLPGASFYMGLDARSGNRIDLVTVLLHEMAHGLGFQTFTDDATGEQFFGIPSIWDHFLVDNRSNTHWVAMSNEQRRISAITWRGLSWNGPQVTAAVRKALVPRANLNIGGANAGTAAGNYYVGEASFGKRLGATPVSGQLMPVVEQPNGIGLACTPLSYRNAMAVRNNIALVDRGACDFTTKARYVQDAGAIGMIVVDNVPGDVTGLSGGDLRIVIPSILIKQSDGALIKAALSRRSRTISGVTATLGTDPSLLAGADAQRRVLMYTPSTLIPGSTVSHYTTEAKGNLLMEPSINADLKHIIKPPMDLTLPLLRDIGW